MPARSHSSVSPTASAGVRPATPRTSRCRHARSAGRSVSIRRTPSLSRASARWRSRSHQFGRALDARPDGRRGSPRTRRARTASSATPQIELGRYAQAFRSFQHMVDLKPSLSSYARVSYARELNGDLHGAIQAMKLALDAAAGDREGYAWTAVQLGKLYWLQGDAQRSRAPVPQRTRRLPGLRLRARRTRAGGGRARQARAGDRPRATGCRTRSRCRSSSPSSAISTRAPGSSQGACPVRDGSRDRAAAGRERDQVGSRDCAVPRRPWDRACPDRRACPAGARLERPSILGDDTLSWALARAGRCQEALGWSRRALRLGTQDWLLDFHRGHDRALPRSPRRGGRLVPKGARAQPAVLGPVEPTALKGGRVVKRLALVGCAPRRRWRRSSIPAGASAHPLGNFTINRSADARALGQPPLRLVRPRPRRDPDVPGRAGRRPARPTTCAGSSAACTSPSRGSRSALRAGGAAAGAPSGPGRPADDALRGGVRRARRCSGSQRRTARRRDVLGPHRVEGGRSSARGHGGRRRLRDGARDVAKRLPPHISEGSAAQPARRHDVPTATVTAGPAAGPAPALSSQSSLQAPDRVADTASRR